MRRLAQARNPYSRSWLWIPGSLVSLAPRNDEDMTDHYDALETREPAMREADLFARLPDVLRKAMAAPAYAERLKGIDPAGVTGRAALARLPVLRTSEPPISSKSCSMPLQAVGAMSPRSSVHWSRVQHSRSLCRKK